MSDSRARLWFALFVLVIFCAGLGTGMVIGRRMGPPAPGDGAFAFLHGGRGRGPFGPGMGMGGGFGMGRGGGGLGMGRGGGPAAIPPGLVQRLSDELQLDATQRAQVEKILEDRRARLEEVHREAREKFDKEAEALHDAVRAVLRPDQQQKFDDWLRRHRP